MYGEATPSSSGGVRRWPRFATAPASSTGSMPTARARAGDHHHRRARPDAATGHLRHGRRRPQATRCVKRKEALKALQAARHRALKLRRVRACSLSGCGGTDRVSLCVVT